MWQLECTETSLIIFHALLHLRCLRHWSTINPEIVFRGTFCLSCSTCDAGEIWSDNKPFTNFVSIHKIDSKNKLSNIKETIPLNISIKPGIDKILYIRASFTSSKVEIYRARFRDFRDFFAWTYAKMPSIDPNIVVYEIKMYHDAKSFS